MQATDTCKNKLPGCAGGKYTILTTIAAARRGSAAL